jgi:hypothetical protein
MMIAICLWDKGKKDYRLIAEIVICAIRHFLIFKEFLHRVYRAMPKLN